MAIWAGKEERMGYLMELLMALAAAVAALIAALFGWRRSADKAKEEKRRGDAAREMRELENEASTHDDIGLARRISRGGM